MTLPPLATSADAAGYGYNLPADSGDDLLARASVRIRRAAGQPITPSVVTLQVPVECGCAELPAPPVIEVQAVATVSEEDGSTTPLLSGWFWDGTVLRLPGWHVHQVQVTYRRGWTVTPDGIVELTCQVANRLADSPVGMEAGIRERAIDDYREVYAAEATQSAGDLLPGELAALRRELGGRDVWAVKTR
ncbi:hypothetical protein [Actinacidiphila glaucinigra]|uniref:hypothetical protein n=1 Tax=Actinacidiphila glaucinigra TaxID=235986 RepID=UPI0035D8F75B